MPAFRYTWLAIFLCLAAVLAWPVEAARAEVFTDEIGRQVELEAPPGRILALTPSLTEIVYALGLGHRLVGATTWADYPEEARALPRVGGYIGPNVEKILALGPDLVLANREGNPPQVVQRLERVGVKVYVTYPGDPLDLPASLARLGRVLGAGEAGEGLERELGQRFELVRRRLEGVQPVRVLMVLEGRPVVSVGPDSYSGRLLRLVRAENIVSGGMGDWPRLSLEFILAARPELVIVSTMEIGQNLASALEYWEQMPGLAGRPGFRVGRVTSDLVDRPGPRLGQGLMMLARLVHPEAFEDQ